MVFCQNNNTDKTWNKVLNKIMHNKADVTHCEDVDAIRKDLEGIVGCADYEFQSATE